MSDFDKEAERERLREKYERDEKKRAATEKMSDLLLKGATMTNAHCDTCSDPIFRYEGQEFCPTCEEVVTAEGEAADDGAAGDGAAGDEAAGDEADERSAVEDKGDERAAVEDHADRQAAVGDADPESAPETAATETTAAEPSGTTTDGDESGTRRPTGAGKAAGTAAENGTTSDHVGVTQTGGSPAGESAGPSQRSQSSATGAAEQSGPVSAVGSGGDLATARQALVRTVTTHAQRAEQCEDPRRARDHLEAAREAAETLSSLPY